MFIAGNPFVCHRYVLMDVNNSRQLLAGKFNQATDVVELVNMVGSNRANVEVESLTLLVPDADYEYVR